MDLALHLVLFLAAGLLGGVLLGLIGVGMALVTVPLLMLVLPGLGFDAGVVPLVALATSMAVVTVGSVSSVISHHAKGNVAWPVVKTTLPASLTGILAGTLLAPHLPAALLRGLFCLFLVYIAQRMLRQGKAAKPDGMQATTAGQYRAAGGLIGLAASVIGAGGGVLMVPFLTQRGHAMARAVATSTMIGLPVSLLGAVIYAAQPVMLPQPLTFGYLFLPAFAGLAVGSALGAPLGTRLGGRIPAATLKRGFALALLAIAVTILIQG